MMNIDACGQQSILDELYWPKWKQSEFNKSGIQDCNCKTCQTIDTACLTSVYPQVINVNLFLRVLWDVYLLDVCLQLCP